MLLIRFNMSILESSHLVLQVLGYKFKCTEHSFRSLSEMNFVRMEKLIAIVDDKAEKKWN